MTTARIHFETTMDSHQRIQERSLRFMAQALYHECSIITPIHLDVGEARLTIVWEPGVPMQSQRVEKGRAVSRVGGYKPPGTPGFPEEGL